MSDARKGRGAGNGGAAYRNAVFWDNLEKLKKERIKEDAKQNNLLEDEDEEVDKSITSQF